MDNPQRRVYGRQPGWSLSARGRAQAEAAARALRGWPLAALYSSPLERAVETAQIIGGELDLPLTVREDLTESALAARWEGLSWREVRTRRIREWRTYLQRPLAVTGVPETLSALAERMGAALRSLAEVHAGQEVVVVSHGDPIKAGVIALTGGDLARLHELRLPTGGRLVLEARGEAWHRA